MAFPSQTVPDVPPICVRFNAGSQVRTLEFQRTFVIGRAEGTDVCLKSEFVSREHAQVDWYEGQWWIWDRQSSNGLFVAGERVDRAPVVDSLEIAFGFDGPRITLALKEDEPTRPLTPLPSARAAPIQSVPLQSVDRYFGKVQDGEGVGAHTIMVRSAFAKIQKKQRMRYGWVLGALAVVLIASAGYAYYLHKKVENSETLAKNLFYAMKSVDVNIADVEKLVQEAGNRQGTEEVARLRKERRAMETDYDKFLTTLKANERKLTPQDRLILRMARIFGECELTMPAEFSTEVGNYIKKWQGSDRLARAVALARAKGYPGFITREFLEQDLPPQFFYLALQESNFDPYTTGQLTRKGYAKGMWQFIPETAVKYGLKIGPLADFPRPDPGDDRHHYDRATKAAASYIKDLYRTDAQASGLLVMACYNWGENRVLPLVQSMPPNPRERNFWNLLTKHRAQIPQETYDYVFYIASAAVIGENPRLFGFDFDDPLAGAANR